MRNGCPELAPASTIRLADSSLLRFKSNNATAHILRNTSARLGAKRKEMLAPDVVSCVDSASLHVKVLRDCFGDDPFWLMCFFGKPVRLAKQG
jgi:hypothetical protein